MTGTPCTHDSERSFLICSRSPDLFSIPTLIQCRTARGYVGDTGVPCYVQSKRTGAHSQRALEAPHADDELTRNLRPLLQREHDLVPREERPWPAFSLLLLNGT